MSTTYTYAGKVTEPDIIQITADVVASAMTDKAIDYCTWDQNDTSGRTAQELLVVFTNPLSGADKTLLDTIVSLN